MSSFSFKKRSSNKASILFLCLLCVFLISLDKKYHLNIAISKYTIKLFEPVYKVIDKLKASKTNLVVSKEKLEQLQSTNLNLSKENSLLKLQAMQADKIKEENKRLLSMLKAAKDLDLNYIFAKVMELQFHKYQEIVTINRGEAHGVKENMPVVNSNGVVGVVISSSESYSRVLLINSGKIGLPVKTIEGNYRGVLSLETDNTLSFKLFSDVEISVGDKIVTSGLGGNFLDGIPVGVVLQVNYLEQESLSIIKIRPYCDFASLDDVFVLIQ